MGFLDALAEYQDERRRMEGRYTPEETSQAWKELNEQLTNQFELKKREKIDAEHQRNPGTIIDPNSPEFKASPLERWQQQVDALISSKNPILQKQGLADLSRYHQRATESTGQTNPSSYKEYMMATPAKQRSPAGYRQFLKDMKQSTTINTGNPRLGLPLTQAEKDQYNIKSDETFVHTNTGPKVLDQSGFSEFERNSAQFAATVDQSSQIINRLEDEGFRATELVDKFGQWLPTGGSYVLNPTQQVYAGAMEQWVRAKLRKESGAQIPDDEMGREFKTFFPEPGDSESVVQMKRYARKVVEEMLIQGSGGAYESKMFEALEDLIKQTKDETKAWLKNNKRELPYYLKSEYDKATFE